MSEIVAEFMLQARRLREFIGVATPLVSEAKIHCSDEGIRMAVVDPANVAMIEPCHLEAAAFESIEADGQATLGVNLERFEDQLSAADPDDVVRLALNMESRMLEIEYGPVEIDMALIDPDAMRNEPDTPDLDHPNEFTLPGSVLSEAVEVVGMQSDQVHFVVDDNGLAVTAEGDTDTARYNLGDDSVTDAHCPEQCEAIFSLEYMEELVKPIPKAAEVTCTIDTDFPILMSWETADGHLSVGQMCAPRIQSE
jgi:proliferating cell nuclear antigen